MALAPARTAVDTKSVSDSIKHDETANRDEDDEGTPKIGQCSGDERPFVRAVRSIPPIRR